MVLSNYFLLVVVFKCDTLALRGEGAENGVMRRAVVMVLSAVMVAQVVAVGQSGSNESYGERYRSDGTKKTIAGELVDINRASTEEMMRLPGMTKVWADRVVKFRPYKKKTELLEHGVLPDRVYDKVKDFVVAHKMD